MKQLQHALLLMITACGLAVLWGCPPQGEGDRTIITPNDRVVKTLADIRAMDTVTHILGDLDIDETELTLIDGFHNLLRVDGEIRITLNDDLESLAGFEKLIHIGKRLVLSENYSLHTIQGFNSIQYLPKVDIFSHNDLVSIKGFDKLTSIDETRIHDNKKLNSCCISLHAKITSYRGNKPGCNSKAKVKELCSANK